MNLSEIVAKFNGLRMVIVGDAMVDHYRWGRVVKLSQEAPVPVFVTDWHENRPGGAANVARNLKEWGIDSKESYGFSSIKTRFMAGHYQMFREDEDHIHTPDDAWLSHQISRWEEEPWLDAVIISDYAKGTCRQRVCAAAIEHAKQRECPVIVDPKGTSWSKYEGATVICPNEAEYAALRTSAPDIDILEKRGEHGIQIHYASARLGPLVPARARHVFDVCGAGDTVTAAVAASLAAGSTIEQAAEIACIAAGYVVGEVGTAVCPLKYLEAECELSLAAASSTVCTTAMSSS